MWVSDQIQSQSIFARATVTEFGCHKIVTGVWEKILTLVVPVD
jgi:hypothetical protein